MADATVADLAGAGNILLHYDASGASALFTDTGGTTPVASDGESVKCWKPEPDAALQVNLTEATNPPTYTASDNSSGYKAVTFDGTNDFMSNIATGLSAGQNVTIVAAFRYIGSGGVLWSRGNSDYQAGQCSSTSDGLMVNGSLTQVTGIPTGRRCAAWITRSTQFEVNSMGFCVGNRTNNTPAALTGRFYLGGYYNQSQLGNFALNEIYAFHNDVEWGSIIRICKILRTKWGISDPNSTPQMPSGGGAVDPLGSLAL